MKMTSLIIALLCVISPTVHAHPGHGGFDHAQLLHYLAEPLHILPLLVIVSVVVIAAKTFRKTSRWKPHLRIKRK